MAGPFVLNKLGCSPITRVFANTPADSRIGYDTEQISELIRLKSDSRSRCRELVSTDSCVFSNRGGLVLLRGLEVTVQEHCDSQLKIGRQPRMQVADLAHAG